MFVLVINIVLVLFPLRIQISDRNVRIGSGVDWWWMGRLGPVGFWVGNICNRTMQVLSNVEQK